MTESLSVGFFGTIGTLGIRKEKSFVSELEHQP